MKSRTVSLCTLLVLTIATAAHAQPGYPRTMSFNGFLTNPSGSPINASKTINFSIWTAAVGGTNKWNETHVLDVDQGSFSVVLGNTTPMQSFAQTLYMQLVVDGETLAPRTPLTAVPHALTVRLPMFAIDSTVTGGASIEIQDEGVGTVIEAYAMGSGKAGHFEAFNPAGTMPALEVFSKAQEVALLVKNTHPTAGKGASILLESTGGAGTGLFVESESNGRALWARHFGNGHAGLFEAVTSTNTSAAVRAFHAGGGHGVHGVATSLFGSGVYGENTGASGWGGYFKNGMAATKLIRLFSDEAIPATKMEFLSDEGGGQPTIKIYRGTTVAIELDADHNGDGRVITEEIQITGGSDLSEDFDLTPSDEVGSPEPGMVVSIDPDNPGRLRVTSRAYDRMVAGVISGAGGIETGMLMGQRDSEASGSTPIGLVGRVYVLADASNEPIRPGDLMTSSPNPGHAMKVTDYMSAQGAVIGKAMTGLESGTGLVLLLLTLQ